jgi:hypothetical protein
VNLEDEYIAYPQRRSHDLENWQDIIGREWRHCQDADCVEQLGRLYFSVTPRFWATLNGLAFRWRSRPPAGEVEAALHCASRVEWSGRQAWETRLEQLNQAKGEDASIGQLVDELRHPHWVRRFQARHTLLYRGGEAVAALENLVDGGQPDKGDTVYWLLQSISHDAVERLGKEPGRWLCSHCLLRCQRHAMQNPPLEFYGCRSCKRSYRLIYFPKGATGVVAVLDSAWAEPMDLQPGLLRVNWLAWQQMLDFDQMLIVQASDEAVERFAVLAANESNPTQQAYYKTMSCTISPKCALSENTLRILEHLFGRVETAEIDSLEG